MWAAVRIDDRGGATLEVEVGGERWSACFHSSAGLGAGSSAGDPALVASLLPAMRRGEELRVDGPVSPPLLEAARTVQDVFWTWDRTLRPRSPWYQRVAVDASSEPGVAAGPSPAPAASPTSSASPSTPGSPSGGRGTAAFFTGGVDSFHTAVVHRRSLSALVFVHGFDIALDAPFRDRFVGRVAAAAEQLGLPLVEVETDLQLLGARAGVPWSDYHGAALATVGLLLAPHFDRVLVPSTHTYGHLEGLGSHPLLDPLWSSRDVRIVHDGADATRAEKLRRIAEEPAAREHLRVCWENPGGAYNCGSCEKCVRTGVAVRVAGVEGRFPTVSPPSLRTIAATRATGRGADWHDLRADLERTGASPSLRRAVEVVLARHQLRRWRWTRELVR